MRFLLALALLSTLALIGVLASSSCVIDARTAEGGSDAEAGYSEAGPPLEDSPSAMDGDAPYVDPDCGCCNRGVLPLLPNCTGKIAFGFPAADCKVPCKGSVAYALCEGECYSACGCELPNGYTLFDAGYVIGEDGSETGIEDVQGGP